MGRRCRRSLRFSGITPRTPRRSTPRLTGPPSAWSCAHGRERSGERAGPRGRGLPGAAPRPRLQAAARRPPACQLRRLPASARPGPGHRHRRARLGYPARTGQPGLARQAACGGPRLRRLPRHDQPGIAGPPPRAAAGPRVAEHAVPVLTGADSGADGSGRPAFLPAASGHLRGVHRADGRHRPAHRGGDGPRPRRRGPQRQHAHHPVLQAGQVPPRAVARDQHGRARPLRCPQGSALPAAEQPRRSSCPGPGHGSTTPTSARPSPGCSPPPASAPRREHAARGFTTCGTPSPSQPWPAGTPRPPTRKHGCRCWPPTSGTSSRRPPTGTCRLQPQLLAAAAGRLEGFLGDLP